MVVAPVVKEVVFSGVWADLGDVAMGGGAEVICCVVGLVGDWGFDDAIRLDKFFCLLTGHN